MVKINWKICVWHSNWKLKFDRTFLRAMDAVSPEASMATTSGYGDSTGRMISDGT